MVTSLSRTTRPRDSQRPAAPPIPAGEWPIARPPYTSLAAAVQGEQSRWNVPGMTAGVLHLASTEIAAAGVTSVLTRQPVTDDTIFQIGSISKVFTTTLVMQLVEAGLLDLDTPVVSYLPGLPLADPDARAALTLRHLLSHSGGFEGDRFIDYGRGDDALARSIAEFGTLRQWTAPGALFSYCNNGFNLVGRVVEMVCGEPFEQVISERLLRPLGLRTAVYFAEDAIGLPHAVGHQLESREHGNTVAAGYSLPRNVNPAGGIVAPVGELLRFAALHLGDGELDGTRLLPAAAARSMREPVIGAGATRGSYGLGWSIQDYEPFRVAGHGGATRGFRAQLTVVPERQFAIALLGNGESGSRAIAEVEAWALDTYLGFTRPQLPPFASGKKHLESFAGTYTRHDGRFELARDGDGITMTYVEIDEESGKESDESTTASLEPVGERCLRFTSGSNRGGIVELIDDPAGGADRQFLRSSGRLGERQPLTPAVSKREVAGKGKAGNPGKRTGSARKKT